MISVICVCKNRHKSLLISLQSWLLLDKVSEIIIVDWNSDSAINHLTTYDSRIKVVRVINEENFNMTQPLNIAIKLAKEKIILKLDCDYIINPYYNFLEKYSINENTFLSGRSSISLDEYDSATDSYKFDHTTKPLSLVKNYVDSYSPFYKGLTGLLLIYKDNLVKVGGYDENIRRYYSYEDTDLCDRLKKIGLKEISLNYDYNLIHIPHPDSLRYENFEGRNIRDVIKKNLQQFYSNNELEDNVDYAICQIHGEFNKKLQRETRDIWQTVQIDEQNYFTRKMNKLEKLKYINYISLVESIDRQKSIEDQFKKYNITTKAFLSNRFKDSKDIVEGRFVSSLNDGTKGCLVSHVKMIKEWYENTDDEYGFFCEDDLSLESVCYWNFSWQDFIDQLPNDWEFVQCLIIRDEFKEFKFRERLWDDWGVTAYLLKRSLAKKILDTYVINNKYVFNLPEPFQDVIPYAENVLTCLGKSYSVPLFTEKCDSFISTFSNKDDKDVNEDGIKKNHLESRNKVIEWWQTEGLFLNKKQIDPAGDEISLNQYENNPLFIEYLKDTENDKNNLALALYYWEIQHVSPALSFFLRCAELTKEKDLSYSCLLMASKCYEIQKNRDTITKNLLMNALTLIPDRPEAYWALSNFHLNKEEYSECYLITTQALNFCKFEYSPLLINTGYEGKYQMQLNNAISAYWWGKREEALNLLNYLKNEKLSDNLVKFIEEQIKIMT